MAKLLIKYDLADQQFNINLGSTIEALQKHN